ncbi:hypothetical protein AVEN_70885-1 [Araneus ventricosus]|uniref:Uncharacterized protein n=1 Tax=Araneus ventricosus TaxID=182803 RepID=A0A4Y2W7K1_ARAVE|nr:hypothetical protein AVEN_70885-1 [Araneus ventricosus]
MEITVYHQDDNNEVQRPTDWPVQFQEIRVYPSSLSKSCRSRSLHFSAYPFRLVIHGLLCANPSAMGTPIPYFSPTFKMRTLPAPISFEVREPPHVSTLVPFQHLWPGNPSGLLGYPKKLEIQTFNCTAPILISFSN